MSNLGVIITIIFVVIWIVRGIAIVMGESNEQKRPTPQRRRRESMDGGDALEELYADASQAGGASQQPVQRDLSQMTMAERIELARQRAREQAARPDNDEAEALRRARERAEVQARQQQEEAESRARAQQEAAERRRAQQAREQRALERRQQEEQRAQAERQARQRTRAQRRVRASRKQAKQPQAAPAKTGSRVQAESFKRVHHGQEQTGQALTKTSKRKQSGSVTVGPLTAASLRKAFVMKELLDKPIALRDPQDDLLS